jgi:hypothetical protein
MTISTPKPGSGIKQSLFQPYTFQDKSWSDPTDPNHAKYSYLADKCVLVGETYYVRDKLTRAWTTVSKRGVIAKLLTEWGGFITTNGNSFAITQDEIKQYLRAGIPAVDGITYAPGASDFLTFKGSKRLNLYTDNRLAGDTDHIANAEEFLKVIRNSLCAAPDELPLDAILAEINGTESTPFRWVMHWLAARYQRPGYAPFTNLWFIGPLRGVGKGTLISAMDGVLGGAAVGKVSQEDIARGWTNSIFGHEFVEWDEFDGGGWYDFLRLIKRVSGNPTFLANTRNIGSNEHPAIAMHIFSTNDDTPIRVEEHDRQNTFIATTTRQAWADRARALWDAETREFVDPHLVSGFAALLNAIEIDFKCINHPLKTALREELREAFEDNVRQWFSEAGEILWDNAGGKPIPWDDLHTAYSDFVRDHCNTKRDDLKEFKRKLTRYCFASDVSTTVTRGGERRKVRCAKLHFKTNTEDTNAVVELHPVEAQPVDKENGFKPSLATTVELEKADVTNLVLMEKVARIRAINDR